MLFTQRQGESQETPWGLRTGACHVADMGVGGHLSLGAAPGALPRVCAGRVGGGGPGPRLPRFQACITAAGPVSLGK